MAVSKESVLLEFKINSKGVVTNINEINGQLKKLQTSALIAQKGFTTMNSAAGIAGATVTEFGRLVSDSPYGIQGMANNLSQLSSMFGILTVQAGNMNNGLSKTRNVMNLLSDQIFGPVGVVVAFQAVVAAIEAFSRSSGKAAREVSNFNESIFLQTQALEMLQQQLDQAGENEEERLKVLKVLALASKDYRKILEDEDLTMSEKIRKGEVLLQQQRAINNAQESLALSTALVSKNNERGLVTEEEYLKAKQDLLQATKEVTSFGTQEATTLNQVRDASKAVAQATIDLYDAQEDIKIQSGLLLNLEKARKNLLEEGKPFVKGSIDDIKSQVKALEDQRDAFANTSDQIDLYNRKIDTLRKRLTQLIDPEAYKEVEKIGAAQAEGIQDNVTAIIEKTISNTKVWGDVSKLAVKQLGETLDPETMQKDLEATMSYRNNQLDMAKLLGLKDQAEQIAQRAELVKNIASSLNDILSAQADREIAIERNKTTALNDQLRRRLANEQLSAEERDKVNQQISKNEFALVERQNKIAKKQFQREKALKIVMALSDTASSAAKAYLSQFLPIPTVDSPARGLVAAGVATSFGLAQVAAISRLKYTEQGLPTPNLMSQGAGGGSGTQEPSFNIIGAGGQSQLAQAVASQQREPLKAYVVAGDVTTAQSLERNKIQEASI